MSTAYKYYKPGALRRTVAIMTDLHLAVSEGPLAGVHPVNASLTDLRSGRPIEDLLEKGVLDEKSNTYKPARFFEIKIAGEALLDKHGIAVRFNPGHAKGEWIGKENDVGPQLESFGTNVGAYIEARGIWNQEAKAANAENRQRYLQGTESRARTAVLTTAAKGGPDILNRAMSLVSEV